MCMNEMERHNLRVNRSFTLKILREHRDWLPAESAAINLLDMRYRFILPFMMDYKNDPEHPYTVFSARLVRIATAMMDEEWVENYIKNQRTTRR